MTEEETEEEQEEETEENLEENVNLGGDTSESFTDFSSSEIIAPVLDSTGETQETPNLEQELANVPSFPGQERKKPEEDYASAANMPDYGANYEQVNYEDMERQNTKDKEREITGQRTREEFETSDIRPLRQFQQNRWREQMQEPEARGLREDYLLGGLRERKSKGKLPHET